MYIILILTQRVTFQCAIYNIVIIAVEQAGLLLLQSKKFYRLSEHFWLNLIPIILWFPKSPFFTKIIDSNSIKMRGSMSKNMHDRSQHNINNLSIHHDECICLSGKLIFVELLCSWPHDCTFQVWWFFMNRVISWGSASSLLFWDPSWIYFYILHKWSYYILLKSIFTQC